MASGKTPRQRSTQAQSQMRRKGLPRALGPASEKSGWKPAVYRAAKRSSTWLNYNPPKGTYCIADVGANEHDFKPLVCHRSFMDALHDQAIPAHQGFTARSNSPRAITCRGTKLTDTERVPYSRSDGRPIFEVSRCTNNTKKDVWLGGQWTEVVEEDLAAYDREDAMRWGMLLVPIGALVGLMALTKK